MTWVKHVVSRIAEASTSTNDLQIIESPWRYSFALYAEAHGIHRPLPEKTFHGQGASARRHLSDLERAYREEDRLRPQWKKAILDAYRAGKFKLRDAHADAAHLIRHAEKPSKPDPRGTEIKPGEVEPGDLVWDRFITRQMLRVVKVARKSLRVEYPPGSGKTSLRKFGTVFWPPGGGTS